MNRIVALGAETQAASSLALAYPDRDVLCVSDQPVVDGWDLPNTRFQYATPSTWRSFVSRDAIVVPLSARWLPDEDWSLSRTVPIAGETIGSSLVVDVRARPEPDGIWQAKGNRWHRPDVPVEGPGRELADLEDPHGCGLVFQPRLNVPGTIMTLGRFSRAGASFGVFQVFEERFFRDVILQAAESIESRDTVQRSLAIASALHIDGFCAMNWVVTSEGTRLTSLRPVARAAFVTFKRGGIDLLATPRGTTVLKSGLRLNAQPHYASYQPLGA